MQKYVEATGKTEEAAIESALRTLGLDRDDVSVEILERAKSGFLGIGSSPAKVKVTYEAPDEPEEVLPQQEPKAEEAVAAAVATREETIQAGRPERQASAAPVQLEPREKPAAPVAEDETAARITAFLTGLLSHMGSTATPVVRLGEEHTYEVDGDLNVYDMLDKLGFDSSRFDFESGSVSGWVLERLEHIPTQGEQFSFENLDVTVTQVDEQRINKITVHVNPLPEGEEE